MQSLWGGGIISRVNSPEEFWLNDLASLDTSEHRVAWMAGTPEDWATKSLLCEKSGMKYWRITAARSSVRSASKHFRRIRNGRYRNLVRIPAGAASVHGRPRQE
jgi:hypothetical protein